MRHALALLAVAFSTAPVMGEAPPDPQALADRIDQRLAERWKAEKTEPAPLADDAEFLRRVYLDLTGRIPAPRDVYEFLADRDSAKRRKLIDDLIERPRFASHFANVWRALLLSETAANPEARLFRKGFEQWLTQRFREGTAYDAMIRELLAVPISSDAWTAQEVFRRPEQANPIAFYAVKEAKPENLAATVTRLFLGIQIECAQCHDHPFARWTRRQFWNQAAFFAGIERQGDGLFAPLTENPQKHELTPSEVKDTVQALFLDKTQPKFPAGVSPRTPLAEWITSAQNPFFARAGANRLWGHFFGIGIVEPVDDFNDSNPPSHPELLDDLANAFVAAKFDLRHMIRAICLSQAYQRTSARTHASQDTPRQFARMTVKGLSGDQLFDSLALAAGFREDKDRGSAFEGDRNSARARFLVQFAAQGKAGEPETSTLQALALMNGSLVSRVTSEHTGPTLTAAIETPGMTTMDRIDALYLAALSRKPTASEHKKLAAYVEKGPLPQRLADVFWTLLNSAEFRMNH